MSPRRLWLFRVAALLLPVLFVGVLEIVLRLAGYGFDTHFFRRVQMDGRDYFINNETFSYRFFPEQLARWPDPFVFPAVKSPGTVRIFIFGESAAMGDPQPAYGASRYLDVLLRERFPGKKFEVINLGITAINSHVILPIARECARRDGDYWIVYMGNNEMVGPFGAATVFGSQALPRRAAQINLAVQQTRTGQLLMAGLRRLGGNAKNTSWGGMEMFLQNQVAPDDARRKTIYENFAGNLRDIVDAGENSGAKVILNTMSVNLKDCPPFASVVNSNLPAADREGFWKVFADGKSLQAQSNFVAAAEQFSQAVKSQPGFAEAHFRLAQCELALANAAAPDEFQAACDTDALPFRADTPVNGVIRQLAKAHPDIALCDAEKLLAQTAPDHVTGDETFFEHVHFNPDGNFRLGKFWADEIAKSFSPAEKNAATNWISQADCDRALGLTIWNRHFVLQAVMRRMNGPPLSTQFNNEERLRRIVAEDAALRKQQAEPDTTCRVREEFSAAIGRAPADAYLYEGEANFFEAVNEPTNALAAYRKLLELRPDDFYACLQLGRLLGELGQPDEGEPFLAQAARLRPSLPDGWYELGNVQSGQGKFTVALGNFERAAKIRPRDASYLCAVAQMQSKLNRHAEAIENCRHALEMNPNYWEAHFQLAGEFVSMNQPEQAAREYGEVLKLNPRHVVSHLNLGVMLVRFNRFDEAIACFQNALKLEPDNRTAQEYLASVLAHKRR